MVLSKEDGKLFYDLMLPLLDYVNVKYNINKRLRNKIIRNYGFTNEEIKEIANRMWDDVSIIDEYVSKKELCEEHKQIILSWKRCVRSIFVLEAHLKAGSIFICPEFDRVYQVSGIISSWEEMVSYEDLPILFKATLIPFKDVIISDGIIERSLYRFTIQEMKEWNKYYYYAKENDLIVKKL